MRLYSVIDVFEKKKVIHETGSSADVHRLTLCCKGGYRAFFVFYPEGVIHEGDYLRAFREGNYNI